MSISIGTGVLTAQRLLIAVCALVAAVVSATSWAATVDVGSGLRVERPLQSMKDLRDRNLIKQRFDYSCGAAALATLLRYGLNDGVTEQDVLIQLFGLLSDDEKQVTLRQGFSLLHLQRVAQARGFQAEGFRLDPQSLSRLSGPVIVFIQPRGYKHFVVLRKARDGYVQLADPALGNRIMWREDFEPAWNGIVFAILGEGYNENNILSNPPEPLSARRLYALNSPVFDAEVYDFGIGPATSFSF